MKNKIVFTDYGKSNFHNWDVYNFYFDDENYIKDELVGSVRSLELNDFPANGIQDNYWYVRKEDTLDYNKILYDADIVGGVSYLHDIGQEDLAIGATPSAELKFKINVGELDAQEFLGKGIIYFAKFGPEDEWKQIGVFTVNDVVNSGKQSTTLTCYDNMMKLDKEWVDTLTYPTTLLTMFNDLITKFNLFTNSLNINNGNYTFEKNFIAEKENGRTILSYIAECAGGIAYADSTGSINIKYYGSGDTVLDDSKYAELEQSIRMTEGINGVRIAKSSEDLGVSYPEGADNVYKIIGNPIFYDNTNLTSAITNVYNRVKDIEYYPCNFRCLTDYGINIGDKVVVNGKAAIITSKSISPSGITFTSVGKENRKGNDTSISSSITAIRGQANELTRDLTQTVSKISDIESGFSQIEQKVDGISMSVNKDGKTASITIGPDTFTVINDEGVEDVVEDAVGIVMDGYVQFNDLSTSGSTTINGANISTGSITADKLSVGAMTVDTLEASGTGVSTIHVNINSKNSSTRLMDYGNIQTASTIDLRNYDISNNSNWSWGTRLQTNGLTVTTRPNGTTINKISITGNGGIYSAENITTDDGFIVNNGNAYRSKNSAGTVEPLIWMGNTNMIHIGNDSSQRILRVHNNIETIGHVTDLSGNRLYSAYNHAHYNDTLYATQVGSSSYKCQVYLSPNSNTSTSAANLRIGSADGGWINYRSSSRRDIKHDIVPVAQAPAEIAPERLYDVDVVSFKYNDDYVNEDDCRYQKDMLGFIIDDMMDTYPIGVDVEDGVMTNWNEKMIIPAMVALIQNQKKEIDELTARVAELEAK